MKPVGRKITFAFKIPGSRYLNARISKNISFPVVYLQAFLIYVAGFYSNMGNYKSFGDTKFVPNVDQVMHCLALF